MVENVGIAVGIASPSVSVQKIFPLQFPLPVSWPSFKLQTSADVGQCRQCHIRSRRVENVRVAIGIALPSISVQNIFLLPVLYPTFELKM